jgi:DNA repair protein RecO (recombination protein O)
MTTQYKTRGFVFLKKDLNESDRLFSIFTENFGRLDIHAKAIRKSVSKLRSGIDIFYISDIEFIQGKNRKTLTESTKIEKFKNLSVSLEKFKTANDIGKVLESFLKGQEPDKNIFYLIQETFLQLDSPNFKIKNSRLLFHFFLWNFLSILGYKPEVDKCAVCHDKLNPYGLHFSEKLGGVVCKRCLSNDAFAININSDIVKILRLIFKKHWQFVSRLKVSLESQNLFQEVSDSYHSFLVPR